MLIDVLIEIENLRQYFQMEKADGIKKAYYTWDYSINGITAFDTEKIYQANVMAYNQRNVFLYKEITVENDQLQNLGVNEAKILVFRHQNHKTMLTDFFDKKGVFHYDRLGYALGYFPGQCEVTIIEVTLK